MSITHNLSFGGEKVIEYSALANAYALYQSIASQYGLDMVMFTHDYDGLQPPNIRVKFRYRKTGLSGSQIDVAIGIWDGILSQYSIEENLLASNIIRG